MSYSQTNRTFLCLALLASILLLAGCGAVKTRITNIQPAPMPASTPVFVRPKLDDALASFAQMVQAYLPQDRDLIVEVDFMGNNSGLEKELPADIGPYFVQVINRIGPPFRTFRTWESFPARGPAVLPPREQSKLPTPTYKLVGTLAGASEIGVRAGQRNIAIAPPKSDIGHEKDFRETITDLTVECALEGPDHLVVPGATATYRIRIRRNEQGKSFSIYVAGSGVGVDNKLSETQDARDALYDVAAASAVHLLGRALLVPFYRSGSMFGNDSNLNDHVRNLLNQLAREQVEQNIKRLLFIDGDYGMSNSGAGGLSDADRAVIILKMHERSLDFSNRADLAQYAYLLWANLNFVGGAERLRLLRAAQARDEAERALAAARNPPPEPGKSPAEFGWPSDTPIIVLDLSMVPIGMRQSIFAALRPCTRCKEMKSLDPDRTITGIRIVPSSDPRQLKAHLIPAPAPEQIQHALRVSPLSLELIWTKPNQRLIVRPQFQ
jgi:hypothetical protein